MQERKYLMIVLLLGISILFLFPINVLAVTPDFLINQDAVGGANQFHSDVAFDSEGNFVVVFADYRDAYENIYAQRYDTSGNTIGTNFRVNDDYLSLCSHDNPSVAMTPDGRFIIAWRDSRDWCCDIYAQRYDASGNPVGGNIKVNSTNQTVCSMYSPTGIACDITGRFVVTWEDTRNDVGDIYAQRYDNAGNPIGGNFPVNTNYTTGEQRMPDVAMSPAGRFIITWTGEDTEGIYYQVYDENGSLVGLNCRADASNNNFESSISCDSLGNFVITWTHWVISGDDDVYARRFNATGGVTGNEFQVNEPSSRYQYGPSVSMDNTGNFCITWTDDRNVSGKNDIYAQRYDSAGNPIGANFKANDDIATYRSNVSISSGGAGNSMIVWSDRRNNNYDTYGEFYQAGIPQGSNILVNDDGPSSYQMYPSIALKDNLLAVAWYDYRNDNLGPDIYLQMLDTSGNLLGSNIKVNDDSPGWDSRQKWPAVAISDDRILVVWDDERYDGGDIFGQWYDLSASPLGSNFRINDDGSGNWNIYASAASGNGEFIVTWIDDREGGCHIYAQRYDAYGNPVGSNFRIDDNNAYISYGGSFGYPENFGKVGFEPDGGFFVVWLDYRDGRAIYGRRFDSSNTPVGLSFKIGEDITMYQYAPSIAINSSGYSIVPWLDERNIDWDVYAQRLDTYCNPIGTNFWVNEDVGGLGYSECWYPGCGISSNNRFIIAWADHRNGQYEIYAQEYNSDGTSAGSNYKVSDYTGNALQRAPQIVVDNSNIYLVWMDPRRSKGWDIYGKVIDWTQVGVDENQGYTLHSAKLYQNYPNPAKTSTTISFHVTTNSHEEARIEIYNLKGQKIRTFNCHPELVEGSVTWDGKDDTGIDQNSGVYFYELRIDGKVVAVRKMVLIK
ncbi:T9SS C-terminal target domain-containing protein [bacterium]|nr:MAG: T9SS C-terminal target domain-containing protein [bacterium]